MKSKTVQVVATGLLCGALAAAARGQDLVDERCNPSTEPSAPVTQAFVPEADTGQLAVESSMPRDHSSKDSLRRTAIVAGQVLLVTTCLATLGTAAVAAPESVEGVLALCNLFDKLVESSLFDKLVESSRHSLPNNPARQEVELHERPQPQRPEYMCVPQEQGRQPLAPFGVGGAFSRFECHIHSDDEQARQPSSLKSSYHSASARGPLVR